MLAVIANDIDRRAEHFGVKLVTAAGRLVPRSEREEATVEWVDDVRCAADDGTGIRPILKALGIACLGAPLVAALARYDVRRRIR